MKVLRLSLNPTAIRQAKDKLQRYKDSLPSKTEQFLERLCEEGVNAAVAAVKKATGELASGITLERKGDGEYCVVSYGKYAVYVEFGTGVIGSGTYAGDLPAWWQYNTQQSPLFHDPLDPTRWFFIGRDGQKYWTRGQKASSHMAQASEEMRQKVLAIAKEVYSFE